jgi:hypothetical protein
MKRLVWQVFCECKVGELIAICYSRKVAEMDRIGFEETVLYLDFRFYRLSPDDFKTAIVWRARVAATDQWSQR